MKTLQYAGYNLSPLSDEHYIIHELIKDRIWIRFFSFFA
jgi:hypothetical protein